MLLSFLLWLTILLKEYPFRSHYHVLGDTNKLHYIDEGDGPVVVLVHGNPTWSYYYRNLITKLKNDFRVIAVDNIGCGYSDKPQDYLYTLENHIQNIGSLLNSLGLERYSLVLHDWGGAIGMGVAGRSLESIEKIIVMNTAAFRSTRIPFRIRICKTPILGEIIVRLFNGFAWPATFMAIETKMQSDVKEGFLTPYNSWKNRIATHRFVQDIPLTESHRSYGTLVKVEEGLEGIREANVPLLVLWGGRDFCFTDHFYKEWLVRFPEAKHSYYSDAGHYLLEDKTKEACTQIYDFLKG